MPENFPFEMPDDEQPDETDEVSDVEFEEELDDEGFRQKYGFDHVCRCSEDWGVGNLGVVAVCYLNMCREAMDHLAEARAELLAKEDELAAMRLELADRS